jgi:hypothetical protein
MDAELVVLPVETPSEIAHPEGLSFPWPLKRPYVARTAFGQSMDCVQDIHCDLPRMARRSALASSEKKIRSTRLLVAADLLHSEAQIGDDVLKQKSLVMLEPLFGAQHRLRLLCVDLLAFNTRVDYRFKEADCPRAASPASDQLVHGRAGAYCSL